MVEEATFRKSRGVVDIFDSGDGIAIGTDHTQSRIEEPGLRFVPCVGYRHSMLTSPPETFRLIGVFSKKTPRCDDSVFLTVALRRLGAKELLGHSMSPSGSFKLGYSIA